MKSVLKWIGIMAGAMVVAAASAFDFKGIEVGGIASFDEISEKLGTRCSRSIPNRCMASITLADIPGFLMLDRSDDGIVEMITISFDAEHFTEIESVSLKKFGDPQKKTSHPVQNRMGAVFTNVSYTWEDRKGNSVLLQKYGNTIDKSYLGYISSRAVDRRIEEQKKKPADF